jgi:hypothetical protein
MNSIVVIAFVFAISVAAPLLAEQSALCYIEEPDAMVLARLLELPRPTAFEPDLTRGPVVTQFSANNLPSEYGIMAVGGAIHRVPARVLLNSLKGSCCSEPEPALSSTSAEVNIIKNWVNILGHCMP